MNNITKPVKRTCACGLIIKGLYEQCYNCREKTVREEGYALGYQTGFLAGEKARVDNARKTLNLQRWRQLSQLCHPDKHSNSETSQDIQRWLNQIRPDD